MICRLFIHKLKGFLMVSLETPVCEFDKDAIDFLLPGIDGKSGR